ncbi:MAG: hypothetical protein M3541_20455, partial [Acidobacteriota bacterium]|nr:hypothetical protein [Acidobacteriota bacterium]
ATLRAEMADHGAAIISTLRAEMTDQGATIISTLRAEMADQGATIISTLRAEIAERATAVEMRVLHEEVISRLALLHEGQAPQPKRKPRPRKKT